MLWTARIWGTAILLFIGVFLVAHLLDQNSSSPGFANFKELLSFLCFPIAPFVGFAIAWKWKIFGGSMVLLSLATLFILRSDLMDDIFFSVGISIPAILYVVSGITNRSAS